MINVFTVKRADYIYDEEILLGIYSSLGKAIEAIPKECKLSKKHTDQKKGNYFYITNEGNRNEITFYIETRTLDSPVKLLL